MNGAEEAEEAYYTSAPETIWALPEDERCEAFKDIFQQASEKYLEAVGRDNAGAAQRAAAAAIGVIAGLFPDRDNPSHRLILSLLAANVASRSGSRNHILLLPGARIPGTKGGFNMATIAGAGVAAVTFLEARGCSKNKARKEVASILGDHGISRRRDEHSEPIPVSIGALRSWEEGASEHPIAATSAPRYRAQLEQFASERGGIQTLDDALQFLREQAAEHLKTMLEF
ncbi:MAG: hypothetical protein ABJM58_11745 [Alteripontixanthobacter sp.]